MKIIILDFTGCKYLGEIHNKIREAFDFPNWYGENWSAFWDLLWSECDADGVIVKGQNNLSAELKETLDKLYEILERNVIFHKNENLNPFSYEIID